MFVVHNRTWITSDSHFGHHGIIKFGQRTPNHELIMLSKWIECVRDTDKILHLGDVFMGSQGNSRRWASVVARLPGRKYVIVGNHDHNLDVLDRAGFETIPEFEQDGVLFTHEPIRIDDERDLAACEWNTNIHGHTHANEPNVEHDGVAVPGKRYINVCVEHTKMAPVQYGSLKIVS